MAVPYPPFSGKRLSLSDATRHGGGRVAGRLSGPQNARRVTDASADIALDQVTFADASEATVAAAWVSGELRKSAEGTWKLSDAIVHAPARRDSPDPDLRSRLPRLQQRAAIVTAARGYFRDQDFLELETPVRVACPGLEPHLRAFPSGERHWLITSPELHLKRVLAAGAERIVEFARAFRDEERGPWHRAEFTMLEWYRSFAGLDAIQADCEALVTACAEAAGLQTATIADCDLTPPFDRVTVRDALIDHTGLDLAILQQRDALNAAITKLGIQTATDDTWDDLFFRVWIDKVEPQLGRRRPVFVQDYPASQAALARIRSEPWGDVAERFELYACGIELANAFLELNDPDEQRARHEADRAERQSMGAPVYPLDERFLAALESGMPPAAGIALGLDRLIALLLGAQDLDEINAFP